MSCLPLCTCRDLEPHEPIRRQESTNLTMQMTRCYDTKEEYRLVLVGRSGSGKSATGNTILGARFFKESIGTSPTTRHAQMAEDVTRLYKVIDTADITLMNDEAARNEVHQWKALTSLDPTAILLVIPADVIITSEDHVAFQRIRELLDEMLVPANLIVVFTMGDRIGPTGQYELEKEIRETDSDLGKLVNGEAHGRYVLFDNTAKDIDRFHQVRRLFDLITPGR